MTAWGSLGSERLQTLRGSLGSERGSLGSERLQTLRGSLGSERLQTLSD